MIPEQFLYVAFWPLSESMGRITDLWAVAPTQAQLTIPTIHRLAMAKIPTIRVTTHPTEVHC